MLNGSLFDILGPIMVGPSSSHTAGAVRLGNLARLIAAKPIIAANFHLYNSFAKTYKGHGTDCGLLAGTLGYGVEDENIRNAYQLAEKHGLTYHFTPVNEKNHYSPNTVIFHLTLAKADEPDSTEHMSIIGHSIGGGKVYVSKINDYNVSLKGEQPTILIHYKDKPGMIWQVTKVLAEHQINIATLHCTRSERNVSAFMTITLDSMPSREDVFNISHISDVYWCHFVEPLPSFLEA